MDSSDFITTPDGCRLRWGLWRASEKARRGTVLLLHGRAECLEKYEETAAELNRRGYDVFSFDWRGQGMSSRSLPNPRKGHIGAYGEYLADLAFFTEQVLAPRARTPVGVLAHSMGGHIALRHLCRHPGGFRWAVLVSPLIDLRWGTFAGVFVRSAVRLAVALGGRNAYALGGGREQGPGGRFENNRLTSDPVRFFQDRRRLAENPGLVVGGVTFGWLWATFRSVDVLCSRGCPETIDIPVCIVGGGNERIVSLSAQRRISRRLPRGRFFLIAGARHEILRESDAVRRRFWEIFDETAEDRGQRTEDRGQMAEER